MNFKTLICAAAIALVAGVGSANADEEFSTLKGATDPTRVQPLSDDEAAAVQGAFLIVTGVSVFNAIVVNGDGPCRIPGMCLFGTQQFTIRGGTTTLNCSANCGCLDPRGVVVE